MRRETPTRSWSSSRAVKRTTCATRRSWSQHPWPRPRRSWARRRRCQRRWQACATSDPGPPLLAADAAAVPLGRRRVAVLRAPGSVEARYHAQHRRTPGAGAIEPVVQPLCCIRRRTSAPPFFPLCGSLGFGIIAIAVASFCPGLSTPLPRGLPSPRGHRSQRKGSFKQVCRARLHRGGRSSDLPPPRNQFWDLRSGQQIFIEFEAEKLGKSKSYRRKIF